MSKFVKILEENLRTDQLDTYLSQLVEKDSLILVNNLARTYDLELIARFEDRGFMLKHESNKIFGLYFAIDGLIYLVKDLFVDDVFSDENVIDITAQDKISNDTVYSRHMILIIFIQKNLNKLPTGSQ